MTTNTSPTSTKKERPMAEKKRVSAGVLALSLFAGWMWHAAETADPGITGRETNKMATSTGDATIGVINAGRDVAAQSGLANVLAAPATTPDAGQVGGVAGGN